MYQAVSDHSSFLIAMAAHVQYYCQFQYERLIILLHFSLYNLQSRRVNNIQE